MERNINEIDLGMPGSPAGAETVSEPPGAEVNTGNASAAGVSKLPQTPKRVRWSQKENRSVWKCYLKSEPEKRGFMKRLKQLWEEDGGRYATEKQLRGQVSNIKRCKLLAEVEMEEIKDSINEQGLLEMEDIENMNLNAGGEINDVMSSIESIVENEGNEIQQDMARVSVNVERIDISRRNGQVEAMSEEQKIVLKRLREVVKSDITRKVPSMKKVDRKRLVQEAALVNSVIDNVKTKDVTEMNRLLYGASFVVAERLGKMKESARDRQEQQRNEPWWKRRVEKNIEMWRKDLSKIEARRTGNHRMSDRELERMNRVYGLEEKGNLNVITTLKMKIAEKSTMIKRYKERQLQHHQNNLFSTDQKQLYNELNGNEQTNETPQPSEATEFWKGIWSKEGKHKQDAEWIGRVKRELRNVQKMENIKITTKDVKIGMRKMSKWKAPGPDGIVGFWFTRMTNLYDRIAIHLQECIEMGNVPEWMTLGRTVLIQKDIRKGRVANNYRPITCLPLMWKLLTGIIGEKMYEHLSTNLLLPDEQKGCRRKSRGTKDQLLIDKSIVKHCRKHQRNLSMAWIDYKKAYDMVPHSWLLETVRMVGIADNIVELIEESMKHWKTELTANGTPLGTVDIKRGIFQGDALSPLLFVIVLIPLSIVIRQTGIGYDTGMENHKISHLLFMDDLKLYADSESHLDSLIQTVRIVSDDIGMEFGLEKCGVVCMRRGKVTQTDGIQLPSGDVMKEIDAEGYKYLGILQFDDILHKQMKDRIVEEYLRRVKKLCRSALYSGNLMSALNSWAVAVVRYSAGIVDWNKDELSRMDIRTRKLLTMNGALHPRSNVGRLYIPRNEGGRGMTSVEDCVNSEVRGLGEYIRNSEEIAMRFVRKEELCDIAETSNEFKERVSRKRLEQWREKKKHGVFLKKVEGIADQASWDWIRGGSLRKETEGLIFAAQEQALSTRAIRAITYKEEISPLCRVCEKELETPMHIAAGCTALAGKQYKTRHDNVSRRVHWQLCRKYGIECPEKWYQHNPQNVSENQDRSVTIWWEVVIKTDRKVGNNHPDIVVILKKENKWQIIDPSCPMDENVEKKETEKVTKYMDLASEIRRMHQVKTEIVPVCIGAFGTVPKKLKAAFETLGIPDLTKGIQITALIGTAAILRQVLNL